MRHGLMESVRKFVMRQNFKSMTTPAVLDGAQTLVGMTGGADVAAAVRWGAVLGLTAFWFVGTWRWCRGIVGSVAWGVVFCVARRVDARGVSGDCRATRGEAAIYSLSSRRPGPYFVLLAAPQSEACSCPNEAGSVRACGLWRALCLLVEATLTPVIACSASVDEICSLLSCSSSRFVAGVYLIVALDASSDVASSPCLIVVMCLISAGGYHCRCSCHDRAVRFYAQDL